MRWDMPTVSQPTSIPLAGCRSSIAAAQSLTPEHKLGQWSASFSNVCLVSLSSGPLSEELDQVFLFEAVSGPRGQTHRGWAFSCCETLLHALCLLSSRLGKPEAERMVSSASWFVLCLCLLYRHPQHSFRAIGLFHSEGCCSLPSTLSEAL